MCDYERDDDNFSLMWLLIGSSPLGFCIPANVDSEAKLGSFICVFYLYNYTLFGNIYIYIA